MTPSRTRFTAAPLARASLFAALVGVAVACVPTESATTEAAPRALSISSVPLKTCSNSCAAPAFNGVAVACSTTVYCVSHQNGVSCDQGASGMEVRTCSTCGNYQCDAGESNANCPADCAICGDGVCAGLEDAGSCPQDCVVEPVCGDGVCELGERSSCSSDCCAGWPCYLE